MSDRLVVGVDAGATATRCVVATVDGTVLGRGRAGGANQRSSPGRPADALAAALRAAVSTVDTSRVVAGVVGVAGAGSAGRGAARDAVAAAWREAGLPGTATVVTDLEVAFAAGTASGCGLLLVAGTGAAALALRDGVVVHRCDGYGWMLGDEGSAVWIGLRALTSVLAGLDGRGAPTALTGPVTALLTGSGSIPEEPAERAQALVAAAYAMPPARLGELAPLVGVAADAADAVAAQIADEAAERLLVSLDTVTRASGIAGPVVATGSVLLSPGPVADAVRAGIRLRFGDDPAFARDAAAGAAALAIARAAGTPIPQLVHARLVHGVTPLVHGVTPLVHGVAPLVHG